jgi:hypothetical protein
MVLSYCRKAYTPVYIKARCQCSNLATARNFSLLHSVQTGARTHPASHKIGTILGSGSGEDAKRLSVLNFWEKSKLKTEGNNQELKIFTKILFSWILYCYQ